MTQRRFVSMRDPHLAALKTTLVAENWSGTLRGAQRARRHGAATAGVARYDSLENDAPGRRSAPTGRATRSSACRSRPTESHVRIAEAARTRLFHDGRRVEVEPRARRAAWLRRARRTTSTSNAGEELVVEKIVALFTSRDTGISEPGERSVRLGDARRRRLRPSFSSATSCRWRHVWGRARIEVGCGRRARSDAAPARSSTCSRRCRTTRWASTSACRHAGCTARRTAGTCSGTRCSSSRSSACASRELTALAAALPLPPHRPGPPRGDRGRIRGRDVPVAEREQRARGDPDDAPQPASGRWLPDALAPAAPRQRRHRLQRVAVLPGHRRPRVPALLRRGDDPRDRPLLGQHRHLQPALDRYEIKRRDGPRRVPRGVPRPRRARRSTTTRTRTSWRCGVCAVRSTCSSGCYRCQRAGPRRAAGHRPRRNSSGGTR